MSSEEAGPASSLDVKCTVSRGTQFKAFQELNELRKTNTLCDVNIVVQETEFPCHRNVLTSASDYFRAMFTNNFEEQKKEDVKLSNVEADIFEQILNFIYLGEISINNENVTSLLLTCEYLGLHYIEDLCLTYIKNHVPLNNIAGLVSFALRTKRADLIHTLFEYISMNFISLSKSNELTKLPASDLKKLLIYIGPQMNTDASIVLLSKWIQVHKDKTSLVKLLQEVNLNGISVGCLSDIIANGLEGISEPGSMVEVDIQSVDGYDDDDRIIDPKQSLQFVSLVRRTSSDSSIETSYYKLILHSVNLRGQKILMGMNTNYGSNYYYTDEVKAVVLNEKTVYAFRQNIYPDHRVESFAWNIESSVTTENNFKVENFTSGYNSNPLIIAAISPRIYFYCFKEKTQSQVSRALTSYNCERNEWNLHNIVENLIPVKAPNMVSLNNNLLYVIGGQIASNDVYVQSRDGGFAQFLDLRTSRWNRLPNSLFEHIDAAACAYDGKIYVTGGKYLSYLNRVAEVFDPIAGKWSALAPMPICKKNHILVPFDNHLYGVGGFKSDGRTIDFESCVYNFKNDEWIKTFTISATSSEADINQTTIVKMYDAIVI